MLAPLSKNPALGIQLNVESLYPVKQLPHACYVDSGECSAYPKPNNFEFMKQEHEEVEDGRSRP
ncbi:MAG: hypothetical protein F4246_00940 [Rhodothermaceae bacterium]|nr:hypothetical protein [Rhodothermaceae bacterium]MXX59590.1 hypothetical protein [Rhodothermaceae bacterium]MYD55559.1 hypothetical protein [Rhodothermaceae bacterium]